MLATLLLVFVCLVGATHSGQPNIPGKDVGQPRLDLCPFASEIYPCQCTWAVDLSEPDLYCPHIESLEQLQNIFLTAFFPTKWFWRIRVSGAPLGDLPEDLFNDVHFDEIRLNSCNITSVHPDAFRASKPYLDTLELYSNLLTDETFPWWSLSEYPKLWRVHLHHNPFSTFPTLNTSALEDINFWETPITTFTRDQLKGAPNLRILEVNPNLESFPADAYLDLGYLEELDLSNNPNLLGGQLSFGQVTLNSPNFKYLYLSNNAISNIEVDAITGVTSTRLKLFLEDNLLTTVNEDVFKPLMDRMLDGWGELDVEGNPLVCDCDMYWLLNNATFLANVRTGSCNDGQYLHDVDISTWVC
ncbi:hypothetical protein Pmani_034747 [Petrolisthes manimaculis]|uniref:Uncharacterized protein n=1 Tax=Petrolisthes manimaculis TaxID=1843537 RepID=A0AAE1TP31_9EUCA|nr:hypothetical protein Pmani_034747 [Petrolisthes manimaculis]